MSSLNDADSPSGKYARFLFWKKVLLEYREDAKILVLPSAEGRDLNVLRSFQVPPKNIIAIESDHRAAIEVQAKFPDIRIIAGDVGTLVREYKRHINVAFLDFCAPLNKDMLRTAASVVTHGMAHDGIFAMSFVAGHEGPDLAPLMEIAQTKLVEFRKIREEGGSNYDQLKLYLELLGVPEEKVNETLDALIEQKISIYIDEIPDAGAVKVPIDPRFTRMSVLGKQLWSLLSPGNVGLLPDEYFMYLSAAPATKKDPVLIATKRVYRGLVGMSPTKFRKKLGSEQLRVGPKKVVAVDCTLTESEFRDRVLQWIRDIDARRGDKDTPEHMYKYLINSVPGIFNTPKETISAWKAHATRGTYKTKP